MKIANNNNYRIIIDIKTDMIIIISY